MNNDCARCGGRDGKHGEGCFTDNISIRRELLAAIQTLDDYEDMIALAYVKRLIKSRETR